jgi:hypothetical protein
VVFNQAGSAVSAVARLMVNLVPTILAPPTNAFARIGSNSIFTVNAVGNGCCATNGDSTGMAFPARPTPRWSSPTLRPPTWGLLRDGDGQRRSIDSPPAMLALLINLRLSSGRSISRSWWANPLP